MVERIDPKKRLRKVYRDRLTDPVYMEAILFGYDLSPNPYRPLVLQQSRTRTYNIRLDPEYFERSIPISDIPISQWETILGWGVKN